MLERVNRLNNTMRDLESIYEVGGKTSLQKNKGSSCVSREFCWNISDFGANSRMTIVGLYCSCSNERVGHPNRCLSHSILIELPYSERSVLAGGPTAIGECFTLFWCAICSGSGFTRNNCGQTYGVITQTRLKRQVMCWIHFFTANRMHEILV